MGLDYNSNNKYNEVIPSLAQLDTVYYKLIDWFYLMLIVVWWPDEAMVLFITNIIVYSESQWFVCSRLTDWSYRSVSLSLCISDLKRITCLSTIQYHYTVWHTFSAEIWQLEQLLILATGTDVPTLGFERQLQIVFGHRGELEQNDLIADYPVPNTCTNVLRLPILRNYNEFYEHMMAAISMATAYLAV
jgi:hypothetical protein